MSMERIGQISAPSVKRRRLPLAAGIDTSAPIAPAADRISPAAEIEAAIARGYRDGLAEGLADAEAERERLLKEHRVALEDEARQRIAVATAELDGMRVRLQKLLVAVPQALQDQRIWAEELAIEIAWSALARMLGAKAQEGTLIPALCRQACHELGNVPVRVRLAPGDMAALAAPLDDLEIAADPRLAPGSLVLETPRGELHTSLAQRLDAITRALLEVCMGRDREECDERAG